MKVLFIQPRANQLGNLNLGLAYLCAVLHEAGHDTLVLDLNHRKASIETNGLMPALDFKPDIIGYSARSVEYKEVIKLAKTMRNTFPDTFQILGGPHVTLNQKKPENIDAIFMGESEACITEICSDAVAETYIGEPIENLDSLPFPDFSTFTSVGYLRSYPLLTSRGCPFNCSFCCTNKIMGRKWRARSPGNIAGELRQASNKWGFRSFIIIDDCFTLDINRAKEICKTIMMMPRKFAWSCGNGIRADGIDLELAVLMRDSGCEEVAFGIESVDEKVFKDIGKSSKLGNIIEALNIFNAVGVKRVGFFILGLPGSTYETDMKAMEFIKEFRLERFYFNSAVPYPGTRLWGWVLQNGKMLNHFMDCYHFDEEGGEIKIAFETPEYTEAERIKALKEVKKLEKEHA